MFSIFSAVSLNTTFFLPNKVSSDEEHLGVHEAVVFCTQLPLSSISPSPLKAANFSIGSTFMNSTDFPIPANCSMVAEDVTIEYGEDGYPGLSCTHGGLTRIPDFPLIIQGLYAFYLCNLMASRFLGYNNIPKVFRAPFANHSALRLLYVESPVCIGPF